MNVLHVCQNYFPSVGGPQYTMKHVSEKLIEYYNDKVQVCTSNSLYGPEATLFTRIEPPKEVINKVEVYRMPFNRWHYPIIKLAGKVYGKATGRHLPHSITKYRWGLDSPAMESMMAKSDADVIMATTIIYNFSDYPFWRTRTNNPKPFVLYGAIHLHKELESTSPLVQRAKACDCYISNTEFERKELIKYGVDSNKIVTIGTGIEPSNFEVNGQLIHDFRLKYGIADSDIVIGFIGRLVKGKGVAVLIDAIRKLSATNPKVKLLLAGGTTDYVPEIKRARDEEKLPIILIENFKETEKAILYHSLDIFVLGSQSESFGVVFLEAWCCKKPVIGTRMGATESLLSEGSDSLLFESGSADDLALKLEILANNSELRTNLGEAGYNKVINGFRWKNIVAKYRDAYQLGINNFHTITRTATAN